MERFPADHGPVGLGNLPPAELRHQMNPCGLGLRGNEAAARVLVETVDDAGPVTAANPCNLRTMVKQRVDEGATHVARRRMHDHPRGLVDHDDVLVFVQNLQGQSFGLMLGRPILWNLNLDDVSRLERARGLGPSSVDDDTALIHQRLDSAARQCAERP